MVQRSLPWRQHHEFDSRMMANIIITRFNLLTADLIFFCLPRCNDSTLAMIVHKWEVMTLNIIRLDVNECMLL